MKRLDKGENYYYISIPYWKVCHTQDWYFGTDDERFKAGEKTPAFLLPAGRKKKEFFF